MYLFVVYIVTVHSFIKKNQKYYFKNIKQKVKKYIINSNNNTNKSTKAKSFQSKCLFFITIHIYLCPGCSFRYYRVLCLINSVINFSVPQTSME